MKPNKIVTGKTKSHKCSELEVKNDNNRKAVIVDYGLDMEQFFAPLLHSSAHVELRVNDKNKMTCSGTWLKRVSNILEKTVLPLSKKVPQIKI